MNSEIFYKETLTEGEMKQLQAIFSTPLVKKYFRTMGQHDLAELASLGSSTLGDSEVAKKHALIQGKLSTLVALLSIQPLE